MGRILYVAFDDSNPFGSRKPSAFVPYPSFCDVETKAPFPASYNSITISTPRLLRGSTVGPASAYSGRASTTLDARWMKISRVLLRLRLRLPGELSADDWALLNCTTFRRSAQVAADDKTKQCTKFQRLHRVQHPATQADKKTEMNLSSVPLEDAANSALSKGLNYAVYLATLPIEDILTDVEKAIVCLPVEAAEEVRQETVRILKASGKPRDNLSGA
jgi:hypothetical protein